jgi:hypothetical protein
MILSDLALPAEAGFAKAGNRFPSPIDVEDIFFGIMRYSFASSTDWMLAMAASNRCAIS